MRVFPQDQTKWKRLKLSALFDRQVNESHVVKKSTIRGIKLSGNYGPYILELRPPPGIFAYFYKYGQWTSTSWCGLSFGNLAKPQLFTSQAFSSQCIKNDSAEGVEPSQAIKVRTFLNCDHHQAFFAYFYKYGPWTSISGLVRLELCVWYQPCHDSASTELCLVGKH